jgi:hypothetical protein
VWTSSRGNKAAFGAGAGFDLARFPQPSWPTARWPRGRRGSAAPTRSEGRLAGRAAGYLSEANLEACEAAGIEPWIGVKRDEHHPHYSERFSKPTELPANPTPVQRMTHRLKTGAGRAAYALRKCSVEPVFGIIKSVMGFRQFLTRGLDNVQGEWTLVCLVWNLKRMALLRPQQGKNQRNVRFSVENRIA